MLNRDPRLIQFFKSTQFTRDQAGAPIRSTETKNIEEMIFIPQNSRDTRRIRKKIFYQVCPNAVDQGLGKPNYSRGDSMILIFHGKPLI